VYEPSDCDPDEDELPLPSNPLRSPPSPCPIDPQVDDPADVPVLLTAVVVVVVVFFVTIIITTIPPTTTANVTRREIVFSFMTSSQKPKTEATAPTRDPSPDDAPDDVFPAGVFTITG
jgi:hypothetical protein